MVPPLSAKTMKKQTERKAAENEEEGDYRVAVTFDANLARLQCC